MPIKPENRARYPKDWSAISLAARERANWRCQHAGCRALQYAVGHWEQAPALAMRPEFGAAPQRVWRWVPSHGNGPCDAAGIGRSWPDLQRWTHAEAREFAAAVWESNPLEPRPIVIVLTVAHLNHEPEDCRPDNLAAMCQRHHLAYDVEHHRETAQATRQARSGNLELFV